MRAALLLLGWLAAGRCEDQPQGKQLIMLEIERLNYPGEDKVVKRQAQVQYGAPGQFVVRSSDQGGQQPVPPEYLSLLQSLSPQQGQPRDIQQVFITRNPQESFAEFSRPPLPAPPAPPRLSPEQEEMRRLQETEANKHIREQQERALQQALTTGQFAPGFQPQAYQPALQAYQAPYQPQPQPQPQVPAYQQQPQPPSYQPQPQPPSYRAQEPESLSQYDTSSFPLEQQYSQPPSSPQYYQTRSIAPAQAPQKFSYSQVQFGSSDFAREALEPRLVTIQQKLQSQVKSQPEYYSSQEYAPQPQEYNVQTQKQTPTTPQHPQQYLIETTPTRAEPEDEPVVRIPRPRRPPPPPQSLYYKPEPQAPAGGILEGLYSKAPESYSPETYQPRQYTLVPQYVRRPQALPAPDAPSRSAIYVQHSGISKRITTQPSYSPYSSGVPRIPTPQGQRALTSSEIQALSKAGFQISPLTLNSLQEASEISPSYEDDEDVYRSPKSARQSQYVDESKPPGKYPKRIPKPVPLTETERKLLADQGIRNLYRVESSESKDAPVTYVLAIDNTIRKRESDSEQEKN